MRSDAATDSEWFYNSLLEFLEDPDEKADVDALVVWWNRSVFQPHTLNIANLLHSQVFPTYSSAQRLITKESALAQLKEKRAALKARNLTS
jgi:hypothetical protein